MLPFRILPGRHGMFAGLANDDVIARSLELTGSFAETGVRVLRHFVRPGDTVVDAGACIGTMAVPLAQAVGPAGRVLAFEPMRLPFLCLCAAAVLNGLPQLQPRPQALGAMAGELLLPMLDLSRPINVGATSLLGASGAETVAVLPLDALALPELALLKVDAEGMDWAVLEGAAATLARTRPVLYVEAGQDSAARATGIERLLRGGWQAWWHFAHFTDAATLSPGVADPFPGRGDVNLLFVPAERQMPLPLAPCLRPDADWWADLTAFLGGGAATAIAAG